MQGIKCAYCHNVLNSIDFYLEKPEGKICSRCIVKYRIHVGSLPNFSDNYSEFGEYFSNDGNFPPQPLSDPAMERVLVRELEDLLR